LNRSHVRGIGKYIGEIIARARNRHGVRWNLMSDRPDLPVHLPVTDSVAVHLSESRGQRFHTWEQVVLPHRVRQIGSDVLHCPAGRVPWWQPVPTVVTVHDAVPWLEDDPAWPRGWYTDRLLPMAFRACAAVITDSECSRRDITRLWPDLEPKLRVIPLGVGDHYLDATLRPLDDSLMSAGIRIPYLLYLGGTLPRKRLDWALRIFDELDDLGISLVVCGVESTAHDRIRESIRPELRSRLCFTHFIPETVMPSLYQGAVAVLYPTRYEGFGLPALEAQAVGTPILLSALGSLAEVIGPGTVVLDPEALPDWVAVCRRIVAERGERPRPDEKCRTWARNFSWDVCTDRHMEVYREAAVVGRGLEIVANASRDGLTRAKS
jgi:glycosyltransferase involved in cell wall biosynthesis